MKDKSFHFGDFTHLVTPDSLVVELPRGIATVDRLLQVYYECLAFPGYFGFNWNALFDCLCDLEWIDSRQIVIVHKDLPSIERSQLNAYLHVLVDCLRDWERDESHELVVVFPREVEQAVNSYFAAMRLRSLSPAVPIEIECDGCTPLTVRFDRHRRPASTALKYWRTGDFNNSLIEIAINPSSGEIVEIVVKALHSIVQEPIVASESHGETGVPVVSMSQWKGGQQSIDMPQEICGSLANRELTVVACEAKSMALAKLRCGRVVFLTDHLHYLRGFQVLGLSEADVNSILSACGVDQKASS